MAEKAYPYLITLQAAGPNRGLPPGKNPLPGACRLRGDFVYSQALFETQTRRASHKIHKTQEQIASQIELETQNKYVLA